MATVTCSYPTERLYTHAILLFVLVSESDLLVRMFGTASGLEHFGFIAVLNTVLRVLHYLSLQDQY